MKKIKLIEELSEAKYRSKTDAEISKEFADNNFITTHGNKITPSMIRAARLKLPKSMRLTNKDKYKEMLLDLLDENQATPPTRDHFKVLIGLQVDYSTFKKNKMIGEITKALVKNHEINWLELVRPETLIMSSVDFAIKYNLTKSRARQFGRMLWEGGVMQEKKRRKQKLAARMKADVQEGYQFCDIKEKYQMSGKEVREVTDTIGFNYGYNEAKKKRNRTIRKMYKNGKTYKDIIGKFCDISDAVSIYQVTKTIRKRRKTYDDLDMSVNKAIKKGLKKTHPKS